MTCIHFSRSLRYQNLCLFISRYGVRNNQIEERTRRHEARPRMAKPSHRTAEARDRTAHAGEGSVAAAVVVNGGRYLPDLAKRTLVFRCRYVSVCKLVFLLNSTLVEPIYLTVTF